MPYYDYRCVECKHELVDVKRSIKEKVGEYECPKCGGKMIQLYRGFDFELKGYGWPKDNFSSGPSKK